MAASRMKNDFAPSWLKLPNQENLKPTPQRTVEHRTYERSFSERSSSRHIESTFDDFSSTPRVARQRSNGLINGYNSGGTSIQRSHMRPGRSGRAYNQMNGSECGLMAAIPQHRPGRRLSTVGVKELSQRFQNNAKSSSNDDCGPNDQSNNMSIDEEFPSLSGDQQNQTCKPSYSKVASVWDGSMRESSAVLRSPGTPDSSPKPLLLKTSAVKRPVVAETQKSPKLLGVAADGNKLKHRNSQKEPQPTVMLTAKVLSACLKQPKDSTDRRSSFFKLMRRESQESCADFNRTELDGGLTRLPTARADSEKVEVCNGTSGIEKDRCHDTRSIFCLSSTAVNPSPVEVVFSSEGELRLMQEMGWNEADYDGEEYGITDDDVREFHALCRKLQQEQLSCPKPRNIDLVKPDGYVAKILRSLSAPSSPDLVGDDHPSSSVESDFSADDEDSDASNC